MSSLILPKYDALATIDSLSVRVVPRYLVETGRTPSSDGLVSLTDPEKPDAAVPPGAAKALLRLRLDDHVAPVPGKAVVLATEADVQAVCGFARATVEGAVRDGLSAVMTFHCEQGVSRSAAMALAVLADHAGPGREEEAVAALMRAFTHLAPNPLIVRLADAVLERRGALVAALKAWQATSPHGEWGAYADVIGDTGA